MTAAHLGTAQWQQRKQAHEARVEAWIRPRLDRRRRGERHPVDDFLFDYYTFRPGQLARWHPGPGTTLEAPVRHLDGVNGFRMLGDAVVGVDPDATGRQAALLAPFDGLLAATAARRPRIGCSALHEWAMVYRVEQSEVRHANWPLRLSPAEIADVVDGVGLRCTHFDAYRFFTPAAQPRNPVALTRADQPEVEQPGCIHATMDLYKWAYRLSPLVGADLIADTFDLARRARHLDMRAAPYDLRELGIEPLQIETAAGRAAFAALQRDLAEEGQRMRAAVRAAIAVAQEWRSRRRRLPAGA